MRRPHALLLPFPAQGHVLPLMELACLMASQGFIITFINTNFNHARLLSSTTTPSSINFISIPDGMQPEDDRNDIAKLCHALMTFMPLHLRQLINIMNIQESDKPTCFIADEGMAWALDVAKKTGLRSTAFSPASANTFTNMRSVPYLIEHGIINEQDGSAEKPGQVFILSPGIPPMNVDNLSWNCFLNSESNKIIFQYVVNNNKALKHAEFVIFNSFYEAEKAVFDYLNSWKMLPIGPLLSKHSSICLSRCFWAEDKTCKSWLDEQSDNSVIYVAFGSLAIIDERQFQELALGLELTGRPFLWVIRPDLTGKTTTRLPEGFSDRIRGKIVEWSPQQEVLAHPALACFITHCGWNSTMEGVSNGVPFLCWPYFADQHLNQSYICDVWKTGLKMMPDENGLITKEEIRGKVEELFGDEGMKKRALALKEMAMKSVDKGGSSFENFITFIKVMKDDV
ncbi:UDP-glucuronosyl/UDP-glucosyltransferase protein [Dioscorea alata]|uniref:UDP-glucuronosyl/UDP-glucosyltransferase protein n=3 Tax=Dioscorea alata TaxID=55571 RepID=A0ACB7U5Y7_DIOAL|nr:UDP-glucuronosyl/UDP-glucosyltransferase protein [Dioscorea alata]KAH7655725.1 UDP-glucuronosyl/UDP-glucosyltransferase protein [Dioscorea alata]KAH7655726.1 UDP-glucuronosyl/UDP-glucosyltransferase protein [Dioscorea alata]